MSKIRIASVSRDIEKPTKQKIRSGETNTNKVWDEYKTPSGVIERQTHITQKKEKIKDYRPKK